MDAETIKREAGMALEDLELDSSVSQVTHSGGSWCIHFSGDYGQFCDSFQDQFGRDSSARVIREKIKKHLLGQITQLRNKGGRRTTRKGFDEEADRLDATELFQETITQTTRAMGEAIDRTLGVTGAVIKSANDVAETLTSGTSEVLRTPLVLESNVQRTRPARAATRKSSDKGSGKKRGAASGKAASKKGASKKTATKGKRVAGRKKAAGKKSGSRKR
jgi:hypothetical protein